MLITEITCRFRNRNISVSIDNDLLEELDCDDTVTTQRIISVNFHKLIYAIGTIQTRRSSPSNRQKFSDKTDLIEYILTNTNDFRVNINKIRNEVRIEDFITISEDFGVGISVIVAMNLFDIEYSTIQRIYGRDKRPDWSCQTLDNRIIIVESKGTSDQNKLNTRIHPVKYIFRSI